MNTYLTAGRGSGGKGLYPSLILHRTGSRRGLGTIFFYKLMKHSPRSMEYGVFYILLDKLTINSCLEGQGKSDRIGQMYL